MIRLDSVSKTYHTRRGNVPVLKSVDLQVSRGERLGILGMNGAGKSTLIRLISGVEQPSSGKIRRDMSISWPLAFGGAFLGMLTGLDNFRFICRLYNVDPDEKVEFVRDFAELGVYFNEPLKAYSSGMRARLAFAISMAVEFDCFLIDEIVAVGDARFQEKCNFELFEKRGNRAFIIVSHHADFIRSHCNKAAVLMHGQLHHFASVDDAYVAYNAHLAESAARALADDKTQIPVPGPVNVPEKDREEAMMEQQISGLSNLVAHALKERLDDEIVDSLVRSFMSDNAEPDLFTGVVHNLRIRGDIRSATRFAEIVVRGNEANSLYSVSLGDLYYIQNDDRKAIDAFKLAVVADGNSFWGQRNLGLTYFKLGCYEECLPHFSAAVNLSKNPAQQRELVWLLIDAYTYLDRAVPADVRALASVKESEFLEFTPIYYSAFGMLRVRVLGLLAPEIGLDDVACTLVIGEKTYPATNLLFGTNSIRRFAEQAGAESFTANFYIPLADVPETLELRLSGATSIAGFTLKAPKPLTLVRNRSEVIIDGRVPPAEWPVEGGSASLADRLFLSHDNDMACIYYGLAEVDGEPLDSERFAEALIALGRFHEAEWHLAGVFAQRKDDADLLGEYGGKLFDLLCMEVARSRLTGWSEKIGRLVHHRLNHASGEAAGLANLGHLRVHEGRLPEAINAYAEAAVSAQDREVIHFARGITSARFAPLDVSTDQPVGNAPSELKRLVHLFSCDSTYFKRYARAVISSAARAPGAENIHIHAHIVDPDVEALELARKLQGRYDFQVTSEFFPFPNAPHHARVAYYTSARFINAQSIMRLYDCPVLITETDCQIHWDWNEILGWCAGCDYGSVLSSLWNWVPWTKIPAGIVYLDNGAKGQAIAQFLRIFLMRIFSDPIATQSNLWTVDQVALWLAWERFHEHVAAKHLPMTSILTLATGDKSNILGDED